MHAKTDSDVTASIDGASPPRTRPMYYVESPSQAELEKLSLNSSPIYSPPLDRPNHHYQPSPIHHSRESSTSRFSYASLKQSYANSVGWWPMRRSTKEVAVVDDTDAVYDDDEDYGRDSNRKVRIACVVVVGIAIVLAIVSLILWGVSKSRRPVVDVQNVVFERFDMQAGVDDSGVSTEMVSLNVTVVIKYVNRGTFFGVYVSSTPWEFYFYQLAVASGDMEKFYTGSNSERTVVTSVQGHQVPVYGAVTAIKGVMQGNSTYVLPLKLTLTVHSKGYIMGKLVRSNFYNQVRCPVILKQNQLGTKLKVRNCDYQ